jgi:Tol biopolymer transport system component
MATGGAEPDTRSPSAAAAGRLDSWKEIAAYLRRGVRTVTRWEREQALPVHRHKTGTVYAYKSELDAWWTSHGQQIETEPPGAPQLRNFWWRRLRVTAAVVGLIITTILTLFLLRPHSTLQPKLVPLTTYPGIEGAPSLSPDGNQVAFCRKGDIFVKQVDGEALLQLTDTPADEAHPIWSPDGRQIAFVRDGSGIFLISPLGGGERGVVETHALSQNNWMTWTPDSKSLIISELTTPICASLFIVSIETGEKTRLTWPPEPSVGDRWPSVSPDGQTLAFARFVQDNSPNIYVVPLTGGEPRRITSDKASQWGLTWTPDGKEVVFSSERTGGTR